MSYLKKTCVFLVLLVIFIASNWALLNFSDLYHTHDATHASRIADMTRALEDGHFPVRWTENFGFGMGMPLFEFYAPLPFYLGSFLYWFGLDILSIIKLLYIVSGLLALLGSYKLGSKLFGRSAGLVAAAAFSLAPYRAVNIFVRGAMSEAWGIMATPWVLLAIVLIIKEKENSPTDEKKAWILLILALVTLILSHNLTTLMFVPVSLLFAIFYAIYNGALSWKKNKILNKIIKIISAYLLSIGLSSFYLFPALLEKDFTKIHSILRGYFYYSHHFLYIRQFLKPNWGYGGSEWGPGDGLSFFLGYGQLLALIISLLILVIGFLKILKTKKLIKIKKFIIKHFLYIFFILIFVVSLYLSLLKSQWLWDSLPLINYIQFPWRFMTVAILFLSLISAYTVILIKSKPKRYLFSFVLIIIILLNSQYFQFDKSKTSPWEFRCLDEACIREKMSWVLPDYIFIEQKSGIEPIEVSKIVNDAEVEILVNRGHEKLFKTNFEQTREININIAGYPGWKLEINGEEKDWHLGEIGNIAVDIPAGEQQIGVYFAATPIRQYSDIISFISLLIFLYFILDLKK